MKKLAFVCALLMIAMQSVSARKIDPKDFTMRIAVLDPGILVTMSDICYYALDCAIKGTVRIANVCLSGRCVKPGDDVVILGCPLSGEAVELMRLKPEIRRPIGSCPELPAGEYMARTVQKVKWQSQVPYDEHMRPLVQYDVEVLLTTEKRKATTAEYWIVFP